MIYLFDMQRLLLILFSTCCFYATKFAVASEMTFTLSGNGGNCIGCEWIAAEGVITPESDKKLIAIIQEGNYNNIVFNSPGGNLAAALRMGRAIREAGYATSVGKTVYSPGNRWKEITRGECLSACAFAFLGGTDRYVTEGKIGIHQFYSDIALERPDDVIFTALDLSASQYIEALLMEYAIEMNIDYRFVLKAAATLPNEMHYLTQEELADWRVEFDSSAFQDWQIEAWKDGVIAFSRSNDEKTTATFFCIAPDQNRLMITEEDSSFKGPFGAVRDYGGQYLYALGLRIPSINASMSETDRVYRLILDLGRFNIEDLDVLDEYDFRADSDAPNVTRPYFYFRLTPRKALANIGIAMKNCI